MKCLTLFVHAAVSESALDALREDSVVTGFTVTRCEGHSTATTDEPQSGPRDRVVGYVPRVRIDVILQDEHVDDVLARLQKSARTEGSWGTWTTSDVVAFGRL